MSKIKLQWNASEIPDNPVVWWCWSVDTGGGRPVIPRGSDDKVVHDVAAHCSEHDADDELVLTLTLVHRVTFSGRVTSRRVSDRWGMRAGCMAGVYRIHLGNESLAITVCESIVNNLTSTTEI